MPTKFEKELLALAAAERQRRAMVEPDDLPDICQMPVYVSQGDLRQNLAPEAQVLMGEISARLSHETSNANGDVFPNISVAMMSEILMSREARAQAALVGAIQGDQIEDPFQIEYSGEFLEGSTQPNEAARFRIGRDTPPSVSMVHRDTVPTDGRVVSRRGDDGRFRSVEGTQPVPAEPAPLSPRPTFSRLRPAREASGLPVAPESQDRSSIPTAWERVAGDDPFDD